MATITTQDVFGTPLSVGQQVLVRTSLVSISGTGPTAQITCQLVSAGNLGDLTNTVIVGPKQLSSPTHPTGVTQTLYGTYLDTTVGRTILLRGTISSITGSGPTASLAITITNNGNIGDLNNPITAGCKQVAGVPAQ